MKLRSLFPILGVVAFLTGTASAASFAPSLGICPGTDIISRIVCTSVGQADAAIAQLRSLEATASPLDPIHISVALAEAQVYARNKAYTKAQFLLSYYAFLGGSTVTNNSLFWDMSSKDMRTVLTAHGGTHDDNIDARPSNAKPTDSGFIWVYDQGGAVSKVYTFNAKGKLLATNTP
jgi:hypothetical protein